MIRVGRVGKYYTLNNKIVKPHEFFGINGFKFANHIVAGIDTGNTVHFDTARRYIENEVLGLGCRRMRAPIELMFWSGPYFDLPVDGVAPYNIPNVANTPDLVDLHSPTGSKFRGVTPKLKKVIRHYVRLAREFDIIIEIPVIWTIKGKATKRTKHYPDPRLVKNGGKGISAWNEHYLASKGIGGYMQQLFTEGDGEGSNRVDPGGLNFLYDHCNEYTVGADPFTKGQLRSMARRWQHRDAPSQRVILISEGSGFVDEYIPPLESKVGVEGYDGPCKHPPRLKEKDSTGKKIDWDKTGDSMRRKWPKELLDANESQLMLTQAQRDYWIPRIPKWTGLGSTNMEKCERMHRNFIENEIYVTFHTFRSMDTYCPEIPQTVVEETVCRITGGTFEPPPPPPPPPPSRPKVVDYRPVISLAFRDILDRDQNPDGTYGGRKGLNYKNEKMQDKTNEDGDVERGMTEAEMREEMIRSAEYTKNHLE